MRTNKIISAILVAATMLCASCTSWVEDNLVPIVEFNGSISQFSVDLYEIDETRAGIHDDDALNAESASVTSFRSVWHEGDNLTILKFNAGQTTPQIVAGSAISFRDNNASALFAVEPKIHTDGEQYALYPKQASSDVNDYTSGNIGNREFKVTLPEQTLIDAADGECPFRYPLLLGHWLPNSDTSLSTFRFSNPFTVLRIKLCNTDSDGIDIKLNHINIKGNNGELMWGAAVAKFVNTEQTDAEGNPIYEKSVTMAPGAESFLNLDCRVDGVNGYSLAQGETGEFYVCIPAQNYEKGLTVTFFCENNYYMEQPLMTNGVDCSTKQNTVVVLPTLNLELEKSNIFTALVRPTVSTLAVSWTTNVDNSPYLSELAPNTKANYKSEKGNVYLLELWTAWDYESTTINGGNGSAGTSTSPSNLAVAWLIKDNACYRYQNDASSLNELFNNTTRPQRFCFTGLKPDTDYYLRIKYMTPDKWSDTDSADPTYFDSENWVVLEHPRHMRTLADPGLDANTILFEDFSDCVLGGDYSTRSAGYSNYNRRYCENTAEATMNVYGTPYANDVQNLIMPNREGLLSGAYGGGSDWFVCYSGLETGLFDTIQQLVHGTVADPDRRSPALKDWAWYNPDLTENCVLMRAGYVKVGAHYKHTKMITPQLNATGTATQTGKISFTGPATVDVEFWACPYGADVMDDGERPIAVEVLDGGTFFYDDATTDLNTRWESHNDYNTLSGFTVSDRREITLQGSQYTWYKYTVRLTGVLPTSRIAFSANRPEKDANSRFLLDDVCVKLVESTPLVAKLVRATDTTLAFAWSSNTANIPTMASAYPDQNLHFGTDSTDNEVADTYAVAIYDENKTLLGKLNKVVKDGSSALLYSDLQKPMRWIFTGLTPSTKYYFKVWNTTDGVESDYLEASTTASVALRKEVVPLTETAVSGQMLLFENFETCLYGGDHSTRSAGYKHKYAGTGIYSLSSAGEVEHTTGAYYANGCSASTLMFDTTLEQVDEMGFGNWSWVDNDPDTTTATPTVSIRPGYVQIGTKAARNWFVTPSLTNMPAGKSSLRVSFKACPYGTASKALSSDESKEKAIAVRLLTGGSVGSDYQLTGYTVVDTKTLTLEGDNNSVWQDITLQFDYVPQGARIAFGDGRTDDLAANNRWHIDDVKIDLLSNAEIAVGVVRATDTTLNIGWTVTESNKDKDYLALNPKLNAPDYDFTTIDITHNYKVYLYRDEACTDLYLASSLNAVTKDSSGNITAAGHFAVSDSKNVLHAQPTRFTFGGLEPATTYYVVVSDTTTGKKSNSIAVSTTPSAYQGKAPVTDPTQVMKGNTMIFENFGDFYYGGDTAGYACGYYRADSNPTVNYKAEGDNPYTKTDNYDFARSLCDKDVTLFSTLGGIIDDLGMQDWRYWSDDGASRILMKPGYIKLGNGSNKAGIITPLLTMIPDGEVWNVRVRFKAAPYTEVTSGENKVAENDIIVKAFDNNSATTYEATTEAPYLAYRMTEGATVSSQALTLTNPGAWTEYEVVLTQVTSDCRISIGGNRSSAGQSRFFLDDIQVILEEDTDNKYLTGYIWEADGTTPAVGVMVTDGYHVVKTNSRGRYQILYEPDVYKPEYVYYTTPAGNEIGRARTGLPVTYYKVGDKNLNPDAGDYAKDFTLGAKMTATTHREYNATTGKQNKWFLFVMADPQTHEASGGEHNDLCLSRFSTYVAPDLKTRAASWNSAVNSSAGTGQAYGVVLGDVTWNAPDAHKAKMKAAMEVGDTGVYWYTAPGNHDWYQSDSDTSPSISAFKETFGPTRISFDRGDMHIVVMNNVIVKSDAGASLGASDYMAGFTDEEFTWLRNDLSHVDKSKGVVLCVHIPFRGGATDSGSNHNKTRHYDDTLTELQKFQHAYIFSGHTHKNQTYVHTKYPTAGGDYVTEIIHGAACGQFWNLSMSADGSPAGYAIYTFEGPRAKLQRYKAIGTTGSMKSNWKNNMRIYWAPGSTTGTYMSRYRFNATKKRVIANVFMSHNQGGVPGELSGDWVVQLYDPALKKWVNMKRITNGIIEQAPDWSSFKFTVSEKDDFLITPDGETKASGAAEPSDGWRIRNDVDWWWWSNAVEPNTYITNRNGNNWGGGYSTSGYQSSCHHIWYGDLTNELSGITGTGVKVRAIPPCYGTDANVQAAIANGTDVTGGCIYICDTFTEWGRSKSDANGLDWTSIKSAY